MVDFSKTAFVFPGQGSQEVGMGKDIAAAHPIAQETIAEADDIIGFDLSRMMFEGPAEELDDTKITQPALYVSSVAMVRALQQVLPEAIPAYVAGHSLGEFTALTVAGSLSFADGIQLVRERGRLMQEAGDQYPGGMAALLGISTEDAERLVNDISQKTGKPLVIANDNCPGQLVISGDNEARDAAVDVAKEYGAKRVIPLNVSVATHSPLMQPARDEFVKLVEATNFAVPTIPVIGNVTATELKTVEDIREELKAQLTSTVKWTQTTQMMIDAGIETFIEIGSKNVLTGLLRRTDKSKTSIAIQNLESFNAFLEQNA